MVGPVLTPVGLAVCDLLASAGSAVFAVSVVSAVSLAAFAALVAFDVSSVCVVWVW